MFFCLVREERAIVKEERVAVEAARASLQNGNADSMTYTAILYLVFERRGRWLGQQIYEIRDYFNGVLPRLPSGERRVVKRKGVNRNE